ncbi:DMT family transporter [Streptomyces sp. T21Q-yed]|nr:DMT family transporter [Streptomyces sp. T21Q-yed]MDF3148020.1 DMT family transporter [Streptomyces sp. T21Q-yed]
MRRPGWWAAVALNGLGGLLHVVALAFGPLSLVQPLGALTIVFALPMAALFVGRKAGSTAWRGAIMATVGLAGLLSLVGSSESQSLATAERVGVAGGARSWRPWVSPGCCPWSAPPSRSRWPRPSGWAWLW